MNANYLRSYLRKQPEKIEPQQVRRIIAALDDRSPNAGVLTHSESYQ
ncbi:MAG TPA: hypothetical protein VF773_07865 [Verrucomicrobiae bacterium]